MKQNKILGLIAMVTCLSGSSTSSSYAGGFSGPVFLMESAFKNARYANCSVLETWINESRNSDTQVLNMILDINGSTQKVQIENDSYPMVNGPVERFSNLDVSFKVKNSTTFQNESFQYSIEVVKGKLVHADFGMNNTYQAGAPLDCISINF